MNIRLEKNNKKFTIGNIVFSVIFTTFLIELLNQNIMFLILPNRLLFNFIIIGLLYLFFICVTNNIKFSLIFSNILLFIMGFSNYFITTLRGTPLSILDILSIGTGLTIADTYTLVINAYLVFGIICFIFLIIVNSIIKYKIPKSKETVQKRIYGIIIIIMIFILLFTTDTYKIFFLKTNLWVPSDEYHKNGFLASFVKQTNELIVKKPKDYSINNIEKIYNETVETSSNNIEEVKQPNIIVIMNESFSDMQVHHEFGTNIDYMPYFKTVYNGTIHGTIHTSVYGGKTPNSEWEFLTNNSMAFFSYGSVPYQQFIRRQTYSLVSTLEAQGYDTSAIHTWHKTGYRRSSVYPLFGFNTFIALEDCEDELEFIREYPSDLSTYKQLTKLFESRDKTKPFFNFTITMQNHSGYDYEGDDFTPTVHLTDIENCPRVEQYLSLIKESDEALKYLIDYFSNVDEDTIILFFGDHQPPYIEQEFWDYINQDKTDSLEDAEKGYLTPYFIWANYELDDYNVSDISLNYLSILLLDIAGLNTTPYQDFLRNMRKEIPVITGHGYMDKLGVYHDFKEENEYTPFIKKYEMLQFNTMFSGKEIYKKMFEIN